MYKAASSHRLSEWFRKEFSKNCLRSPIRSSFQSISMSFQSPVRQSVEGGRSRSRLGHSSTPNEEFVVGCSVCGTKAISEMTEETSTDPRNSGSYVKLIEKRTRPASSDLQLGKQARRTSPVYNDVVSLKPFKLVKEHIDPGQKTVSTVRYNEVHMSPRAQLTPLNYEECKLVKESMLFNPTAKLYVREEERKRVAVRRSEYANRAKGTSTQFLLNTFCEENYSNNNSFTEMYDQRSNLSVKQNILANKSFSISSQFHPPEQTSLEYQNGIDQHMLSAQPSDRSGRMKGSARRAHGAERQLSSNELSSRSSRPKNSSRRAHAEPSGMDLQMSSRGLSNKSSRMKLSSRAPESTYGIEQQWSSNDLSRNTSRMKDSSRRPSGESYRIQPQLSSNELYGNSSRMKDSSRMPSGELQRVPSGESHRISSGELNRVLSGESHRISSGESHRIPTGESHRIPSGESYRIPSGESYTIEQQLSSNELYGNSSNMKDSSSRHHEDVCSIGQYNSSSEQLEKDKRAPTASMNEEMEKSWIFKGEEDLEGSKRANTKKEHNYAIKVKNSSQKGSRSTSNYQSPLGTNAKSSPRKDMSAVSSVNRTPYGTNAKNTPRTSSKIKESFTTSRLDEMIKEEKSSKKSEAMHRIEMFRPPKLDISQKSPKSGQEPNLLSPLSAQSRQSAQSPTSSRLGLSPPRVHLEEIEVQLLRSRREGQETNENRGRNGHCVFADDQVIKGLRLIGGFADYLEKKGLSVITRRH